MSICCADLLELKSFQNIKLIAGQKGLYRKVTWPFSCYTSTVSRWLHGGEMLFIMIPQANEMTLLDLIGEAVKKDLAGMVILKGDKYTTTIPPSLIEVANNLSFPLFEMPWDLRLIDIIREIAELIIIQSKKSERHTLFIKQLLFSEIQNQDFKSLSIKLGIEPKPIQCVSLVRFQNFDPEKVKLLKSNIILTVKFYTKKESCEIICMELTDSIICLALTDTNDDMKQLNDSIIKSFNILKKRYPDGQFQLSFGSVCNQADNIQQSYEEAKQVLSLMDKKLVSDSISHYSDLGIFRLIFEIQNCSKTQDYCLQNIKPLIELDMEGQTELLKTLQCYLHNNCNLKKTSQELFIHRNTLYYRINLIEESLEKDLDDAFVRHELFLSIIIAEFLGLIEI